MIITFVVYWNILYMIPKCKYFEHCHWEYHTDKKSKAWDKANKDFTEIDYLKIKTIDD